MTTNAFIFSWDQLGIESIIPITQYEKWDQVQLMQIMKDGTSERNPLTQIVNMLTMRARFNNHRHYEIYAIDCNEEMDKEFWEEQWEKYPQETAELIRERGVKLYSDRADSTRIKIV